MPYPCAPPPRFSLAHLSPVRVSVHDLTTADNGKDAAVSHELLYDCPYIPDFQPRQQRKRRPMTATKTKADACAGGISNQKVHCTRLGPLFGASLDDSGGDITDLAFRGLLDSPSALHRLPPLASPPWSSASSDYSSGGSTFSSPPGSPPSSTYFSLFASPKSRHHHHFLLPPPPPPPRSRIISRKRIPVEDSPLSFPAATRSTRATRSRQHPLSSSSSSANTTDVSGHRSLIPEQAIQITKTLLSYAKSFQEAYVGAMAFSVPTPYFDEEDEMERVEVRRESLPGLVVRRSKEGYSAHPELVKELFPAYNYDLGSSEDLLFRGDGEEELGEGDWTRKPMVELLPAPFTCPSPPAMPVTRGRQPTRSSSSSSVSPSNRRSARTMKLASTIPSPVPSVSSSSAPASPPHRVLDREIVEEPLSMRIKIIGNPVYLRLLATTHRCSSPCPSPTTPSTSSTAGLAADVTFSPLSKSPPKSSGTELAKMGTGREKLVLVSFSSSSSTIPPASCSPAASQPIVPPSESDLKKQRRKSRLSIVVSAQDLSVSC